PRDGRAALVRIDGPEELGEAADLLEPAAGRGDGLRGFRKHAESHRTAPIHKREKVSDTFPLEKVSDTFCRRLCPALARRAARPACADPREQRAERDAEKLEQTGRSATAAARARLLRRRRRVRIRRRRR